MTAPHGVRRTGAYQPASRPDRGYQSPHPGARDLWLPWPFRCYTLLSWQSAVPFTGRALAVPVGIAGAVRLERTAPVLETGRLPINGRPYGVVKAAYLGLSPGGGLWMSPAWRLSRSLPGGVPIAVPGQHGLRGRAVARFALDAGLPGHGPGPSPGEAVPLRVLPCLALCQAISGGQFSSLVGLYFPEVEHATEYRAAHAVQLQGHQMVHRRGGREQRGVHEANGQR